MSVSNLPAAGPAVLAVLAQRSCRPQAEASMAEPEAGRIWLIPLAATDAAEMTAVLGGQELYAFTGGRPPTTRELEVRYSIQVAGPAD